MNRAYDISLYGHLTLDRVFSDFNESYSIGAMGNVWDAIVKINPTLSVSLNPSALGEAIILIDKEKRSRYSLANLNVKTKTCHPVNSKWHHVLYLNELNDTTFLKELSGVVSADICKGKPLDYSILKDVDYLFISDEDITDDLKTIAKLTRGSVVLHHPQGSTWHNGKQAHVHSGQPIIENLNVLGAGDFFAAAFISSMLETNNIKKSIIYAHETATELLAEENRK